MPANYSLSGVVMTLLAVSSGVTADIPPAPNMKALGMIGGTSWHSTIECYRHLNQSVNNVYGNNTNPPLILYNLNQREIHALQLEGRWTSIAEIYSEAISRIGKAGAQAAFFCANTPYKVYAEVSRRTQFPIIHIGDAIGRAVERAGLNKVGLIGTIHTMEGDFIRNWLREHYRIEMLVPRSSESRTRMQTIIQHELGMGIFKATSKRLVLNEIQKLEQVGAEGIILGCTEFSLIIRQSDVQLPLFDSTSLHSQLGVEFILGQYEPRSPEK